MLKRTGLPHCIYKAVAVLRFHSSHSSGMTKLGSVTGLLKTRENLKESHRKQGSMTPHLPTLCIWQSPCNPPVLSLCACAVYQCRQAVLHLRSVPTPALITSSLLIALKETEAPHQHSIWNYHQIISDFSRFQTWLWSSQMLLPLPSFP